MNSIQTAQFIVAASKASKRKSKRPALSTASKAIRAGVKLGLTDLQIAGCLAGVANSPVRGLTLSTASQYVGEARRAMGIRHYNKAF